MYDIGKVSIFMGILDDENTLKKYINDKFFNDFKIENKHIEYTFNKEGNLFDRFLKGVDVIEKNVGKILVEKKYNCAIFIYDYEYTNSIYNDDFFDYITTCNYIDNTLLLQTLEIYNLGTDDFMIYDLINQLKIAYLFLPCRNNKLSITSTIDQKKYICIYSSCEKIKNMDIQVIKFEELCNLVFDLSLDGIIIDDEDSNIYMSIEILKEFKKYLNK